MAMRLKSLFALFFALSFGLLLSSCTPGVYVGASAGYPAYGGYYGPRYYAPRYYGPRYYARPLPPPGPRYYGGDHRGFHPGPGPGGFGGRRGR